MSLAMRVLLAAVLTSLALALGGPAGAAPLTRPSVPGFCREWDGDRVVALACDPERAARSIRLDLGAEHAAPTHELGVGQFDGAEPLQPGETLTLTWSHPSSHAVLEVTVAAPEGPRDVVLDLRARPARVEVTAQPGGALQVTTPAGTDSVPAPPHRPP
jgi:hypothetical protein